MDNLTPFNASYITCFRWLICCLFLFSLQASVAFEAPVAPKKVEFIENKGQWPKQYLFRSQLGQGSFYMEKNAFQYFLVNDKDVKEALKHPRDFWEEFKKYTVRAHSLRMEFAGASENATSLASNPYKHYYNFYLGNDPSRWASEVKPYQTVTINQLYTGIDLKVTSTQAQAIKYDLIVAKNTDPRVIKLRYNGAEKVRIKSDYLYIYTSVTTLVEKAPYAYQEIDGKIKEVSCHYKKLDDDNLTIGFEVGAYNPNYPLIIDPELIFSTYSGSSANNFGATATYDSEGNLYAAGITTYADPLFDPNGKYPTTPGAFQMNYSGGTDESWPQFSFACDITISKYNNDGTQLLYATYLGGQRNDYAHSLVVDKQDRLVILGSTLSSDFPVLSTSFDQTFNDSFDIIVTKFNQAGTALIGSTYVGGSHSDGLSLPDTLCMNYMDHMRGEVLVDQNNDVVVGSVTSSVNFPVTSSAFQKVLKGAQDGCVFKLDSNLATMKWASYLGDSLNETLNSIDFDSSGDVYAVGGTHSKHFPVSPGVYATSYRGGYADAYIARISSNGSTLQKFMYWGSPDYDQCYFVKTDRQGNVYVMGQNFDTVPVTNGTYHNVRGSIFVSSFKRDLDSLRFSTRIGNGNMRNVLVPSAFMVDICDNIYASLWGGSLNLIPAFNTGARRVAAPSSTVNLPVTSDALQPVTDGKDFYLFVLSPGATSLKYASYMGEIGESDHVDGGTSRFDSRGIVYQSVCASCDFGTSGNFPTTPDSYSPNNQSPGCSNASLKMDFRIGNIVVADFDIDPRKSCTDSIVKFTNTSYNGVYYKWYINNVLKDTTFNYKDTFRIEGTYSVKLVVSDSARCNVIDSITKTFGVKTSVHAAFSVFRDTCSPYVYFKNLSQTYNNVTVPYRWSFGDGDTAYSKNTTHAYLANGTYTITLTADPGSFCQDTETYVLKYDTAGHILKARMAPIDSVECEPMQIHMVNTSISGDSFYWYINDTLASTNKNFDTALYKGNYTVKLVVKDSLTCIKKDSTMSKVKVYPEGVPDFNIERDTCSFTLHFTNTSILIPGDTVKYKWYFGDGDSSTVTNPIHTYKAAGNYTITLLTNPGLSCSQQRPKNFNIDNNNNVLVADFEIVPPIGCIPASVQFNNTSVNGSHFYWWINDVLKDSTKNLTMNFDSVGSYIVRLVSMDSASCKKSDTTEKTLNTYPFAKSKFTSKRDSCSFNVLFFNQTDTTGKDTVHFLWNFGDGTTSTLFNPKHFYFQNGSYNVLLITNPGTACADTSNEVIVYDSIAHVLIAAYSWNDSFSCVPAYIDAKNESVNNKYNYWYVNGDLRSTNPNYKDTVTHSGPYRLTLVIIDSTTCKVIDSASKTMNLDVSANADFTLLRDSCSLDVKFKNNSSSPGGDEVRYKWYFGDGDSSTEKDPIHTYAGTDFYTVTLICNEGSICSDTMEKTYFIDGDTIQEVFIPNIFTPNGDSFNECFYIKGITKCDRLHIWIRNRWGNLYYESTDPLNCWNGKNAAGSEAPDGVYYYIINLQKKSGLVIDRSGTVTLIRE